MNKTPLKSWQAIQNEVIRRINDRTWPPGHLLPNEVDLAVEFGCARATVNRALQSVAEKGLLERRRKAGTRVAVNPVRKATLSIPIIREEIEQTGRSYHYRLIRTETKPASSTDARDLQIQAGNQVVFVAALHCAGGEPFVYEERLVNMNAVPGIENADFDKISANEWLVQNAPFTHGSLSFSAHSADIALAGHLDCATQSPVFCLERHTWNGAQSITKARLFYAPGYRLETLL